MKREPIITPLKPNGGDVIGPHTAHYSGATARTRHIRLQKTIGIPDETLYQYAVNIGIGAGFYVKNKGLGWDVKKVGTGKGFIVKSTRIANSESRGILGSCGSLAKFTETKFNPLSCGTISLGHPVLYTGELLSDAERNNSPKLDASEGNSRYKKEYSLQIEGQDVPVRKYRSLLNILLYCTSIIDSNNQALRLSQLQQKFALENYDSVAYLPYANVDLFAMELGLLFGVYGMYSSTHMRFIQGTGDAPIIEVFHGPVLYVSDRDQWLNERGVPSGKPATREDIIPNFVKNISYAEEREYRFLLQTPSILGCSQLITPTGEAVKCLFSSNPLEYYWKTRIEKDCIANPMQWMELLSQERDLKEVGIEANPEGDGIQVKPLRPESRSISVVTVDKSLLS